MKHKRNFGGNKKTKTDTSTDELLTCLKLMRDMNLIPGDPVNDAQFHSLMQRVDKAITKAETSN